MSVCRMCGQPEPREDHILCAQEWNKRHFAGKCIRCDERESERDDPYCAECNKSDDSPYVGYPPEAPCDGL